MYSYWWEFRNWQYYRFAINLIRPYREDMQKEKTEIKLMEEKIEK